MILAGIGMAGSQQIILEPVVQCFTTNGTWSCCPGAVCLEVVTVGAGGAGGAGGNLSPITTRGSGGGGGGGGGGVSICTLTSGFGASQSVVVGSGNSCFGGLVLATKGQTGAAGFSNFSFPETTLGGPGGTGNFANGGAGGNSSFDSTGISVTATNGSSVGGGAGGRAAFYRFGNTTFSGIASGGAGSTVCGLTRGAGGNGTTTTGCPGQSFGGGGAGGSVPNNSGGNGGAGIIQVTQFFA